MTRTALVFGARGQIGHFLLPRLQAAGWCTHAVTRANPPASSVEVRWHALELFAGGDLDIEADDAAIDTIFSLGPLDGFNAWLQRSRLRPRRVIAFSSTSADSKQTSPDARERELALRLQAAEIDLLATCSQRDARATLLRPTLVYGIGRDRNLTRIAQLARRWRGFVLPRGSTGLRQPVHAEDLAEAAWQVACRDIALAPRYDLPGGETLEYREMVRRVLASLDSPVRLVEIPAWPVRAALWCVQRAGGVGDAGSGVFARLGTDLVYNVEAARRDLGYAPRQFHPQAEMFVSSETM